MIKIKEKKQSNKKQEPGYTLKIEYMIGDADGHTSEEGSFPLGCEDVIEKFCKILDKIEPLKGTWGIVLDRGIDKWFEEGQITEDEFNFWTVFVDREYDEDQLDQETLDLLELLAKYGYGDGLGELVRGETEYSFLVYQDYKLKYIDENGNKHNTYFE